MNGFLGQLGRSLADRWLNLLVLPGALYVSVVLAAGALGHAHPFDLSRLADQVSAWARSPGATTVGGQVVLVSAVLAAAGATGLAARGLGGGIELLVLAADWRTWPRPLRQLADRLVAARRTDWDAARRDYDGLRDAAGRARALGQPHDPAARHAARAAMIRIAWERPDRPTWSGDRVHATAVRLNRDHHLDLAVLWPHFWLTLPDSQRAEITAARDALTRATTLGGWAVLYALLAVVWWPAAVLAVVLAAVGRRRTRAAAQSYAQLLEAAVRLNVAQLAGALGVEGAGGLTSDVGDRLSDVLDPMPLEE